MWFLDTQHRAPPFAFYDFAFNKEWCERVDDLAVTCREQAATTGAGLDLDTRVSKVRWIDPTTPDASWLFRDIVDLITKANEAYFRFDLLGLPAIQHTTYAGEEEGKYDLHIDSSERTSMVRKLSCSILLSPPSDFEGGKLELVNSTEPMEPPHPHQGQAVLFPSFTPHRVTPVVSGTRRSLVVWAEGAAWR